MIDTKLYTLNGLLNYVVYLYTFYALNNIVPVVRERFVECRAMYVCVCECVYHLYMLHLNLSVSQNATNENGQKLSAMGPRFMFGAI